MRDIFLAGAVALVAAGGAHAAEDAHARALAAGYKAAFLCSGIFNAGQTEAQATGRATAPSSGSTAPGRACPRGPM